MTSPVLNSTKNVSNYEFLKVAIFGKWIKITPFSNFQEFQ